MAQQPIRLGDRLQQLDKEARAWTKVTRKKLLMRLASLNLQERVRLDGEVSLRKSLRTSVRKSQGELESVGFSFARHGIFLEHGVGRGRPKGSAAARRYAKPWLSVVLPDAVDELAEMLSDEYGDIVQQEMRLLIPGVVDIVK